MDSAPALTTVLVGTITSQTPFASATYVIAEPTITNVDPMPNFVHVVYRLFFFGILSMESTRYIELSAK
ncbi:hypothetical protein BGZ96_012446 [Linnemannia gamsii]|uniref:Uncharacterized protein n=1 Tax=Linnemannia gamsii TaxID=64522 RepID=A0ABQ7KBV3_9FUNG|nr:hypothetical protein BGZ96_012446 [Linnemannia gamsii]